MFQHFCSFTYELLKLVPEQRRDCTKCKGGGGFGRPQLIIINAAALPELLQI